MLNPKSSQTGLSTLQVPEIMIVLIVSDYQMVATIQLFTLAINIAQVSA